MHREVGNAVWADFIEKELGVEEARKASLEARGVAAVTASGALATVLLGYVTLSSRSATGTFILPHAARPWFYWALFFFTAAVLFALATNIPVSLYWADPDELESYIQSHWNSVPSAQKDVIEHQIKRLKPLHRWNTIKGYALMVGMILQGIAIGLIAIGVAVAL
jgi:hypothetical protein